MASFTKPPIYQFSYQFKNMFLVVIDSQRSQNELNTVKTENWISQDNAQKSFFVKIKDVKHMTDEEDKALNLKQ